MKSGLSNPSLPAFQATISLGHDSGRRWVSREPESLKSESRRPWFDRSADVREVVPSMQHSKTCEAAAQEEKSTQLAGPAWSLYGLGLTLSASAIWGLAPVLTKGALDGFSPQLVAVVRLLVAALLCRGLAGQAQPWILRDRWLVGAGVALGTDFVLYNFGLQLTTAAVAGLLVNVETLATIVLARWLLRESLDARRLCGGLLTFCGAVFLSMDGMFASVSLDRSRLAGNLLVMASAICWSVYAVGQRRSTASANLFSRLSSIFLVATLTVAPTCLYPGVWHVRPSPRAWGMLLALSVLCTFAVYWMYARAQQLIPVSVLAILFCTIPVFSVLFAYILLDEPLTLHLLLGGLIILSGITVMATKVDPSPS